MTCGLIDRSNYFRSLLILLRKNDQIKEEEKIMVCKIAKVMGFEKGFTENAINELLVNEYLIEDPPLFSNLKLAEAFIKDGIKLAFADKGLHIFEYNWLILIANKNNLSNQWFYIELEDFLENKKPNMENSFEIQNFLSSSAQIYT